MIRFVGTLLIAVLLVGCGAKTPSAEEFHKLSPEETWRPRENVAITVAPNTGSDVYVSWNILTAFSSVVGEIAKDVEVWVIFGNFENATREVGDPMVLQIPVAGDEQMSAQTYWGWCMLTDSIMSDDCISWAEAALAIQQGRSYQDYVNEVSGGFIPVQESAFIELMRALDERVKAPVYSEPVATPAPNREL